MDIKKNSAVGKFIFSLLAIATFFACNPSYDEPPIDLSAYQIENGFELEGIASEPLLEAPVAIDFDVEGRIWAVEMRGYMQNVEGTNEEMPNGRIVILEDWDKDGIMDHSKVFLDSLILPRALALVYGGLLYAEPPNLWFVSIENDTPGERVLVDSLYADAGNVEHQPNGLLLNVDNWIYNAKSNFRYKKQDGKWIKSPTTFRGQWGITHDNFGRLYYNHNSALLLGDFTPPNVLIENQYFSPKFGVQQLLTKHQNIFPIHATLVNRGYQKGVLNQDSIVKSATSACGPLIYRGRQFGESYEENAFVCLPEGNLIKRLNLSSIDQTIAASPTHPSKEFLASADKGFRPVNLKTGPDGNLYIVDMHRGIIQHAAYMTSYLKQHIIDNNMEGIMGMGRILKVKKKGEVGIDLTTINWADPVGLLTHPNSWIREKAQHLIVSENQTENIKALRNIATNKEHPIAQILAIRALEGLNQLSLSLLKNVVLQSEAPATSHALLTMHHFLHEENHEVIQSIFDAALQQSDRMVDIYASHQLSKWAKLMPDYVFPKLRLIIDRNPESRLLAEAIVSGSFGQEKSFLTNLGNKNNFTDSIVIDNLHLSLANKNSNKVNPIYTVERVHEDDRTRGLKLYRKICANCHGIDGAGITNLAPPLKSSEFVNGPVEQLGLIVLHGLKGPIEVNGIAYDLNAVMPGLANNEEITNEDISGIINYLKSAFSTEFGQATAKRIEALREEKPSDGSLYTEQGLKNWMKKNNIQE